MCPVARLLPLAALLLLPVPSVLAQTAVNPSGHWEGAIQAPNAEVRIEIDLSKNSTGELAGTFGQPAQRLKGFPLANVAVAGTSVTFHLKGSAPGERAFSGVLAADVQSISGNFSQGGNSFPFSLVRTGDARLEPAPTSPPISTALEGVWNGTLDVNGTQRPLILTMSNQSDGRATGSVLNVDEGLEIPIAAITEKDSGLTLDISAVGGSYSGVLNPGGTELVGTFTLGPAAMRLTFRRAVAAEGRR